MEPPIKNEPAGITKLVLLWFVIIFGVAIGLVGGGLSAYYFFPEIRLIEKVVLMNTSSRKPPLDSSVKFVLDQEYSSEDFPGFSFKYDKSWNLSVEITQMDLSWEQFSDIPEGEVYNDLHLELSKNGNHLFIEFHTLTGPSDGVGECFEVDDSAEITKFSSWFRYLISSDLRPAPPNPISLPDAIEPYWVWQPIEVLSTARDGSICILQPAHFFEFTTKTKYEGYPLGSAHMSMGYRVDEEADLLIEELDQIIDSIDYEQRI